jgi:hypothetical protein
MYYYYTPGGLELITPNRELAFARAAEHGSEVFQMNLEDN